MGRPNDKAGLSKVRSGSFGKCQYFEIVESEGFTSSEALTKYQNPTLMIFEERKLYHVYNQGNNCQKIFYCRKNYLFFLRKIRQHILPHCDILAWCLMPNHFHLMVYVKNIDMVVRQQQGAASEGFTSSETLTNSTRSLNQSVGLMLRSYTRAINKQEKISGSLFRKETKAECLNPSGNIAPSFFNTQAGTLVNVYDSGKEYPQICFDYIHNNPLASNLVKNIDDWEFSSAKDYYSNR
ncbi:MAG: transposase, partial [bacterium]